MAGSNDAMILNAFGKQIASRVDNVAELNTFIRYVERFFDKHNQVVFDKGPLNKLIFTNYDKAELFKFLGIEPNDVNNVVKKVPSIKATWRSLNDPYVVLSVFLVRELSIRARKDKAFIQKRDMVLMWLAFKVYSTMFTKYFKHDVNEDIMMYTLNSLTEKFRYKQLQNNYAVMKDVVLNSHMSYEALLILGKDDMMNTYFPQIYSRINKVIQNIANNYYDNYKNKNYLRTTSDVGEDGQPVNHETSTSLVESSAESATNYFFASKVDIGLVRKSCDPFKVPSSTMTQALMDIRSNVKISTIKFLYTSLLSLVYDMEPALMGRMCSSDFTAVTLRQISISNSSNPNLEAIKNTIDKMLIENCGKFAATNRLATKMAYRSALYRYFVLIMIFDKCS